MAHIAFLETNTTGSGYEAIAAAKRAGHRVTFVTRDIEAYLLPGQLQLDTALIDDVVSTETNDPDQVVAALQPLLPGLAALISIGEWHMISGAESAYRLGLPGQAPDSVRAARIKSLQRAACSRAGVPVPAFAVALTPETAAAAAEAQGFPCIVKPVDYGGSYGVRLCTSADEVAEHAVWLHSVTHNQRDQRMSEEILVEEYLEGPEISLETLTFDGVTRFLAITQKQTVPPPSFYETGHALPAVLDPALEQECRRIATDALDAIGYVFGAGHIELKLTTDGPKLIEVNCRPAGDRITHLLNRALDIDPTELLIEMYLGIAPDRIPEPARGAAIVFLPSPGGRVVAVEGVELARSVTGVEEVELYVGPGDVLAPPTNNNDRLGYVTATGPDSVAALAAATTAAGSILVKLETE
ncbi:ATP-grasp domain-containing protein [Streptomyces prunicolor]|uniref:ATP-grasp domain-containing protein n=1 Tax=Streptomyces prunicolor TaxID=67348 RepID=UPI00386BAF37|nr:ATP-grasp domain-containing protein [Streptomyces prunicolor]